jgi:hypothetical protein
MRGLRGIDLKPHVDACLLRGMITIHHGGLQHIGHRQGFNVIQVFQRIQAR